MERLYRAGSGRTALRIRNSHWQLARAGNRVDALLQRPQEARCTVTTVAQGTAYEERTLRTLARFGISAQRCGGASDRGIDLRGWWLLRGTDTPPPAVVAPRLRVIGQCKCIKRALGPGIVRELAGVVAREHAIGLLAAARGFSLQAVREWRISSVPLVLFDIEETDDLCHAIRWNDAAADVLHGLAVGRRATPVHSSSGVLLYINGSPVAPALASDNHLAVDGPPHAWTKL